MGKGGSGLVVGSASSADHLRVKVVEAGEAGGVDDGFVELIGEGGAKVGEGDAAGFKRTVADAGAAVGGAVGFDFGFGELEGSGEEGELEKGGECGFQCGPGGGSGR